MANWGRGSNIQRQNNNYQAAQYLSKILNIDATVIYNWSQTQNIQLWRVVTTNFGGLGVQSYAGGGGGTTVPDTTALASLATAINGNTSYSFPAPSAQGV